MSHAAHEPTASSAQERADELRALAGPVNADAPEARTDAAPDEVREPAQGDVGAEADPYELRSMPAQPNPTEDDPASHLNA
ncbi:MULTISPECIES: hypothetical protein [unclassified Actinotalea]|uniref:hypothetical protein n=1 Tax=unclassified Actinotalea TaxID=2638618 RepID=UPI0015F4A26E|nr:MULTISPECIES: hypothetical protein [unclassified Actinotalea]